MGGRYSTRSKVARVMDGSQIRLRHDLFADGGEDTMLVLRGKWDGDYFFIREK